MEKIAATVSKGAAANVELDLVEKARQRRSDVLDKEQIESLRTGIKEQTIVLDTLRAQNYALQANIAGRQRCCRGPWSRVPPPILPRPRAFPADGKGRGKGGQKGSDDPDPDSDSHDEELAAPARGAGVSESLPLAGSDPVERGGEDPVDRAAPTADTRNQLPEEAVWKAEYNFFVCEVGEERWEEDEFPAEVCCVEGGDSASSIAEAVDFLQSQASPFSEDCYLVKDTAESAWYCIWRKGRQGLARETMENFVTDPPDRTEAARNGHGSDEQKRSRHDGPGQSSRDLRERGAGVGPLHSYSLGGESPRSQHSLVDDL